LIVAAACLVIAAAAFGVHHVQVRRQASTLKDRAIAAEAAGNPTEAAELYARYLKFQPKDEEAAMRYLNVRPGQSRTQH